MRALSSDGTIVAYNAPFEKGIIQKLAKDFQEAQKELDNCSTRFWDLLSIFRKHYIDYQFRGSNSLKNVLPTLIPELNYSDLEVSEGNEAQLAWNDLINAETEADRNQLSQQLRDYCTQDTLALVRIFQFLCDKLENNGFSIER